MRKRPSRPQRFAAVDNNAIDSIPSILATGLLTTLIRAKDGDDLTVGGLAREKTEGREALAKAMRLLVEDAYVIKFKIQRSVSETVTRDDGTTEEKRGGSWYTTFTVDSIPFTADDVAAMLEEILEAGNVKSVRVEPTRLDPRKAPGGSARPTYGKPSVGPTCGNDSAWGEAGGGNPDETGPRPTYGKPTVGRPTVGESAAHIRKKTSFTRGEDETGDALSARSAGDARRASDGSSAREAEGGCAASAEDHPSPTTEEPRQQAKTGSGKTGRHTRQQLDTVRAVRAHFPADLLAAPLPDVPALSQAILDALDGDVAGADRTVEQLGARVVQRWNHHDWAEKFYTGQIDSLVGAAVAMVRPLKASDRYGCANPRCEAGRDIDTGVDCHVCPERMAARAAARRAGAVPSPRGASGAGRGQAHRECSCRNPIPKTSDDHLCPDCRKWQDSLTEARHNAEQAAEAPF